MITITNKEFNDKVDLLLEEYEIKQGNPLGRQAKATKRGTLLEDVAELFLKDHPNVKKIETQVYCPEVDDFSLIDLVVHTKTGNKVYIPVARDLWLGTSQMDRLQVQALKFKSGILKDYNYCYLVGDCFKDFIVEKCKKGARKKPTVQNWVKKLWKNKMLFTFDELYEHINTI